MLEGPARTFFFNNAKDEMEFTEMETLLVHEYNSNARQTQVRIKLESLSFEKFMVEESIEDTGKGLTKMVELIEDLSPQAPNSFRDDSHKIGYLRKALTTQTRAHGPISRIVSHKYSFNEFVLSLHEIVAMEVEIAKEKAKDNTVHTHLSDELLSFFQRYGRNPKDLSRGRPNPKTRRNSFDKKAFEEAHKKNVCVFCKSPWKPGHPCHKREMAGWARAKIEGGTSAVHVLTELIDTLNEYDTISDASTNPVDVDKNESIPSGFTDAKYELSQFDSIMATDSNGCHHADLTAEECNFVERLDEEWFTNMLSASITSEAAGPEYAPPRDFQ